MATFIAPSAQVFANSYSAIYSPGLNFIAVHLLNGTGNHLADLLGSVPDGTSVARFDNTMGKWGLVSTFRSSAGAWDIPPEQLFPGEGAFLYLNGTANITTSISGNQAVLNLPLSIPSIGYALVSRQTEVAPSSYDDIMGLTPLPGVVAYQFEGGFTASTFDMFGDGSWDNAPSVALGNSVWFTDTSGGPVCPQLMPPITIETQPAPTVTVSCGQPLTLTAKVNYLPGMAHTYRWEKNSVLVGSVHPMSDALYPFVTYTVPAASSADAGNYVLIVEGGSICGGTSQVTSSVAAVSVVTTAVNAVPTLGTIPNPAAIKEDAAMRTVNLTGISAGPATESWQTIAITATSSNPTLIPNPTVIYTSGATFGSLTYTPVANQYGTATITVTATDNGLTACLPDPKSKSVQFNVVVNPVNDAPSFIVGPTVTLLEDAPGVQTVVGHATGISKGPPNESAQLVNFIIVNVNKPSLFSTQPFIDPNGNLHFQLAPNQNGTAIVTVRIHDDGGMWGGGLDTSVAQTFKIKVTPVNDAPTLTTFSTPLTGAFHGVPFKILYSDLVASGDENDVDGDPIKFKLTGIQTANGTLTKSNGSPVTIGTSQLTVGQYWLWTPIASGLNQPAISVVATDGALDSAPSVWVSVDVQ
ncbi:MAG: Ig-like domain-containing protein [Verrucomicrobia bacterium]|nr:Ig-like domain-containing protein [Verrucomicrobiota bacterium]